MPPSGLAKFAYSWHAPGVKTIPGSRSMRAPAPRSLRPSRAKPTTATSLSADRTSARLVTLRANGQMTLPADLRQRVGARTGDVFVADVEDHLLVLRPKRLIDAEDAWFWTPEWQKGEREATADIKAGRVKSFRSVEELIAELHR